MWIVRLMMLYSYLATGESVDVRLMMLYSVDVRPMMLYS